MFHRGRKQWTPGHLSFRFLGTEKQNQSVFGTIAPLNTAIQWHRKPERAILRLSLWKVTARQVIYCYQKQASGRLYALSVLLYVL